jgi:hypothetical protein
VTMKVRSSSGKPVAWRRAQTMARSSSVAFQGSLCGRLEWSWQSCALVLLRKNGELLMKQEDLHAEDPFYERVSG